MSTLSRLFTKSAPPLTVQTPQSPHTQKREIESGRGTERKLGEREHRERESEREGGRASEGGRERD